MVPAVCLIECKLCLVPACEAILFLAFFCLFDLLRSPLPSLSLPTAPNPSPSLAAV
jgi:hypothetical protein